MFLKKDHRLRVEVVYWYEPGALSFINETARMARLWGSDALRLQLRDFMAPHLPESIDLSFSGLPLYGGRPRAAMFQAWLKTRRPGVFILMKNVANRMAPDELEQLRKKAIAIGVDHKDNDLSRVALLGYDFHISSTDAGRRAIDALLDAECPDPRRRPLVKLLPQSYDQRLAHVEIVERQELAPVYIGDARYAAIPDAIRTGIRMLEVERREDMDRAIRGVGRFNFHYAVRPDPPASLRRIYKPFTKGATAAACHSNILVNRQVDDAVAFLTDDYPYLVDSNADAHVEDGFRKAKEEFGGPEWARGLEIMRSVRESLSGPAQARQFADIVTSAAERGSVSDWGAVSGEPAWARLRTEQTREEEAAQ